jgi:hypothetical protein
VNEETSNQMTVTITLGPRTYDTLVSLANQSGSVTEALRRAIELAKWMQDVRSEGARVLIEKDGQLREMVPVS